MKERERERDGWRWRGREGDGDGWMRVLSERYACIDLLFLTKYCDCGAPTCVIFFSSFSVLFFGGGGGCGSSVVFSSDFATYRDK